MRQHIAILLFAGVMAVAIPACKQNSKVIDSSNAAIDTVPEKMVWIPGSTFKMGSDDPAFHDAMPIHEVTLDGFWMDEHEVTNAEFEKFVNATGYKTVAEQPVNPEDFPGVPAESLVPGSGVLPHLLNRFHWIILCSGGVTYPAQAGATRMALKAQFKEDPTIRLFISVILMRWLMQNGPVNGYLLKRNGSMQHKGAKADNNITGVLN